MDIQERLGQIIGEYDAQGVHRTGTDVDIQSAEWLKGRIAALGLEARDDLIQRQ